MPKTTIAVDQETHALVKRLMHKRELRTLDEAVKIAVDESLARAST